MLVPPPLRPGDAIAIVPTARAISVEELQAGIALAESWGLRVKLGAGVGRKQFQQAGSAEERAADLVAALVDDEVKAVWCARGGYGTVHLLELLDKEVVRKHPKWVVGFSDITVLHSAWHKEGLCTLHAQMPFNIASKSPACVASLEAALFGRPEPITAPAPAGPVPNRTGTAEGELVGGNLSLIYALRGTPYDLDTTGKILFLEDLDELLYHVDRMVMNLKLGGLFDGLAGLVVGGMSDMHDKDPEDPFGLSAGEIIARAVQGKDFPVCWDFPAGHIADNRALVLGQKVKLNVEPAGATLSFREFQQV
ncbi:MAG: LD-carboxypeptidase [Bacteroidetes bacterium]|nr:LD-carboxypeptidase [Bacteroidota bacterium]